jgi:DNA-binding response OmpR family regulator
MGRVKAYSFGFESPAEALVADPKQPGAGKRIPLSTAEHRLLRHLAGNADGDVPREALVPIVSGDDDAAQGGAKAASLGEIREVDRIVKELRLKLGDASVQIKTARGFGYRFASVAALEEEHAMRPPHGPHDE